jgi:two-component system CheB/CheR fusion protein
MSVTAIDADPTFEHLLNQLRDQRGFDFTGYKRNTLVRRVRRRMELLGHPDFESYSAYLEAAPQEFTELFNFILINVTNFFRDPEPWLYLHETLIPKVIASKMYEGQIRIWCAGCASGQEAYSIAILLTEILGEDAFRERVKIYATDVDEEALVEARQGAYTPREVEQIPPHLLEKYFRFHQNKYVFRTDLRRSLIFGRHDLTRDAPISRLDLLLCRNTMMYFNTSTQERLLFNFHFALEDHGCLVLGRAEMLLTHSNLFIPLNLRCRVFSKVEKPRRRERFVLSEMNNGDKDVMNTLTAEVRLRTQVFNATPMAQIVVNKSGHLFMANEQAQLLFGIRQNDLGRPLREMEIYYHPLELHSVVMQANVEQRMLVFKNVIWKRSKEDIVWYDVQIIPLSSSPSEILEALITYTDVTVMHRLQEQLEQTNQELETAYEELQSTNEELETTNEELQSTVEELETTNEEIHSTNEELETINEELQSTNEELETVNTELRRRSDELNQVNAFMEAIFTNLPSAVVVLDNDMVVLVWSQRAEDLWGIRMDEAVGQHFMNLDIGLPVEKLRPAIRTALNGDVSSQMEQLQAVNRRGKAITCQVNYLPLRTTREFVSGVILLMEEQSAT